MSRALLLSLGLVACGSPPPSSHPQAPVLAVTLPAASACVTGPALPTPSAPPAESPCWARGRPAAAPAARKPRAGCASLDMNEVARVERELRRELTVKKPNRLVVDFGCRQASDAVAEVWYEDGGGHGGSLRLARLVRHDDQVSVRRLSYQAYHGDSTVVVSEGQLGWGKLEPLVKRAHVALLARPHELELFDPDATPLNLWSAGWSSHDFHLRLSIVDAGGHVDDRAFTGYESDDEKVNIAPMQKATDALEKRLEAMKLAPSIISDADRTFFNERLRETLAGDPSWWVRERYVGMAAQLGTIDAVPTLLTQVTRPLLKDGSDERTRDAAIAAIAAITGWDPRLGDDHQPRPVEQVVAAVAAACAP